MKKRTLRQIIVYGILMLLVAVSVMACGKNAQGKGANSQTEDNSQITEETSNTLF